MCTARCGRVPVSVTEQSRSMNRPQLADAGAARDSNRQAAISAPLYSIMADQACREAESAS